MCEQILKKNWDKYFSQCSISKLVQFTPLLSTKNFSQRKLSTKNANFLALFSSSIPWLSLVTISNPLCLSNLFLFCAPPHSLVCLSVSLQPHFSHNIQLCFIQQNVHNYSFIEITPLQSGLMLYSTAHTVLHSTVLFTSYPLICSCSTSLPIPPFATIYDSMYLVCLICSRCTHTINLKWATCSVMGQGQLYPPPLLTDLTCQKKNILVVRVFIPYAKLVHQNTHLTVLSTIPTWQFRKRYFEHGDTEAFHIEKYVAVSVRVLRGDASHEIRAQRCEGWCRVGVGRRASCVSCQSPSARTRTHTHCIHPGQTAQAGTPLQTPVPQVNTNWCHHYLLKICFKYITCRANLGCFSLII